MLAAIRREAAANGGEPLGIRRFEDQTGIARNAWRGRFWARWSDALHEAGLTPNNWNPATPKDELLAEIAALVRQLGHWPTRDEIDLARREGTRIVAASNIYRRLGTRAEQVAQVYEWATTRSDWADVATTLQPLIAFAHTPKSATLRPVVVGYVYLLKHGRHHKIGRSNSTGRRVYEIRLQMPERVDIVHEISTDDPEGIEAYWHRRFAAKRANGEWFNLSPDDVAAFKRRSYM